jgi:hypothetical protein
MTGVRTEWHLAELSAEEADPFATVVYSAGVTIDLTASDETLVEQYNALLRREVRMQGGGLTCQLKTEGQDCRECPAATLDPEVDRSRLCRLGKDQAMLEAVIGERMDAQTAMMAPVRELVEAMDDLSEIGEIPDELAELLTGVGL